MLISSMSARGTKRFKPKREMKWAGEAYKKYQDAQKAKAGDAYVTMGRGTRSIKLSDIKETSGRPSGKGMWVRTGRGTSKRKL